MRISKRYRVTLTDNDVAILMIILQDVMKNERSISGISSNDRRRIAAMLAAIDQVTPI